MAARHPTHTAHAPSVALIYVTDPTMAPAAPPSMVPRKTSPARFAGTSTRQTIIAAKTVNPRRQATYRAQPRSAQAEGSCHPWVVAGRHRRERRPWWRSFR